MRMNAKAIASILFLIFLGWQLGVMRGHTLREMLTKPGVKLACLTEAPNSLDTLPPFVTTNLES